MLTAMALLAATPSAEADLRLARMTALYEQVCLKSFPDDKAVGVLMRARNARELTPEEVKVTMRDDPARGWDLGDGGATLWIEFPPYHACSVRWSAPRVGDLAAYRAIADDYERASGGFRPFPAYDVDREDIHIHAVGEQRALSGGAEESLFFFDQHISDPKRRQAGETGVVVRFVHQFAPPAPGDGS